MLPRYRNWFLCAAIAVALIATGTSCTSVPHSPNGLEATAALRAEYFRDHPDGPFNAHIIRGELVPGMGGAEVLASWGRPGQRYGDGPGRENWIYTARDRFSGDAVIYQLKFEDRRLESWDIHRKTMGAGRLVATDNQGVSRGMAVEDGRPGAGMSSSAVLKK